MFFYIEGVHQLIDNPFVADSQQPQQTPVTRWIDATVTSTAPLMVRLDGFEEAAQEPTKPPLVGGLSVSERVLCLMQGRQLVVIGRYGG